MVVLGIDPGLATLGWGAVSGSRQSARLVAYGVIETAASQAHIERLLSIHEELKLLARKFRPEVVAVEELFFYKNAKTAFKVGEARGVVLLTIAQLRLPLREFTPLEVKQTITSYGRADKLQVQKMVKLLLGLPAIPQPDDAADALAVALTCLQLPILP